MNTLGQSSLRVSPVILGAWSYGGWYWGGAEDDASIRAINAAIDAGITSIDTAPVYGFGRSEEVVGRAISGRREEVQILTKVGLRWDTDEGAHFFDTEDVNGKTWRITRNLRPDSIRLEVERSLKRLGVDHIDLVQCHWPDPSTPIPDSMGALAALVEEGKVGAVGVSNFSPEQMAEATATLGSVPLASNQINYSLMYRKSVEATLAKCAELSVPVISYFPLANGLLSGRYDADNLPKFPKSLTMKKYVVGGADGFPDGGYTPLLRELQRIAAARGVSVPQVSINYVVSKGAIPIPGARNAEMAAANMGAMGWRLSEAEVGALEAAADAIGFEFSSGGFRLE